MSAHPYDFDVRGSVDADDVHSDVHEALQPTLFDGASANEPTWMLLPRSSIEKQFVAFDRENKHVYARLEALALAAYRAGVRRLGVASLYETLRYQSAIETKGDAWRLNQNWRAYYARLLLHRHPELSGLIETRKLRARAA